MLKNFTASLFLKATSYLKPFIFCTLLVFSFFTGWANDYYFSSSSGNDSYSSAQAQNQATPWNSLAKLNSIFPSLNPGDNIYLKRGDVFYGYIVVTKSGTSAATIDIGAYGVGNKPLISGFTTLSSWSSIGNGIYQAPAPGVGNDVNMVSFNGKPQQVGRYPNIDAANGGYLTYESYNGTYSITDNNLSGSPNWTGAELVIKKIKYIIENCAITSQSGGTIYYNSKSSLPPTNNYGYFIQRDVRTLDQLGEWYFNPSTGYMQMYFGSNNPSSYVIKASTATNLVNTGRYSYITVSDLAFEGSNGDAISVGDRGSRSTTVFINNCDVNYSGRNGFYSTNADYSRIESCNIKNSYNDGIQFDNQGGISNYAIAKYNIVKNAGYIAGMGVSGDSYQGIVVSSYNGDVEYNSLDSIGHNGVAFFYPNTKINNNLITNFSFIKDDGSGVYTWSGGGPVTGSQVRNNIVLNGIGAPQGTDTDERTVHGVYIDDGSSGVDVSNNSISNVAYDGLYIHNSHELTINNNTLYNNGLQQVLFAHDQYGPNDPIRNVSFTNNTIVSRDASQLVFNMRTISNDINLTGATDYNIYARPIDDDLVFYGDMPSIYSAYSLSSWKNAFNKDKNSVTSPRKILPYAINNLNTGNLLTNGDLNGNINDFSFWSQNGNQSTSWDGSSKVNGTGSLKVGFPSAIPNVYTLCIKPIGALNSSKTYILRFSTLGTTTNGVLNAYFRNTNSPYNNLVSAQKRSFGTSVVNHEFLITAPITTNAADLVIEIGQNSGTTYIDNLQLYEASTSPINIDDQLRFEYNASTSSKTVNLNANYIGMDGTSYPGTLVLAPYTSKVLIKDLNNTTPPPAPAPSSLQATGTAPSINCFGSLATATVSASGGTTPYTGNGTYNVNAGSGCLKISVPSPVSGASTLIYASVGSISSSKNYILRFSTLGTTANGSVNAALRLTNSPFTYITAAQNKTFGTGRVDHEFLFTAPASQSDASFILELSQASGTTYIDNVAFFEATSTSSLISDNMFKSGIFESGISSVFTWSPNGNHVAEFDLSSKITNTYYFPVKDASGSISTATVKTTQPAAPLLAYSTAPLISILGGTTNVSVIANGGTPPYTGTGTINNVLAGNYVYTVTDAAGCTTNTNINIAPGSISVPPSAPAPAPAPSPSSSLTANATAPAIICFGSTTTVTVSASGGTAPYNGAGTFNRDAGRGCLKISAPSPQSGVSTLIYGSIGAVSSSKSYVLKFSTLGTTGSGSLTAGLRMTGTPFSYIASAQTRTFGSSQTDHQFLFTAPASQSDASFIIELLQSSGTTYIDNVAIFEVNSAGSFVSDNLFKSGNFENGISSVFTWSPAGNHIAEFDLTSKIPNTYYFPVTDAAGNVITAGVTITQPSSALQAGAVSGIISNVGGSTNVVVNATGGTPPYTGTGTFNNVSAGTYNYSVSDASGCTVVTSVTIAPGSGSPSFTASANASYISCFGGTTTVTVNAAGGVAPYSGTGSFIRDAGRGSLKISFPAPVANAKTYIYYPIGAISSSKNYILRLTTLGTTSNGSINAAFRLSNSPYTSVTSIQNRTFGTDRVDHEFLFTPSSSQSDASFVLELSQSSGTTYIDNIAVFEASSTGALLSDNLYKYGNFEYGIGNIWTWGLSNSYVAEFDLTSKIENIYYFPITDASGNISTASLKTDQPASPLFATATAGSVSSGGTTTVVINASGGTPPYAGTGSFNNVGAGTYNYTVRDALSCSYVVSVTVGSNAVSRVAATNSTVASVNTTSVSNLSSLQVATALSATPLNAITYPNPTTDKINLTLSGGTNEKVIIALSSVDGKVLYKTEGTSNNKYVFGNGLIPGMYIIQVIQGNKIQTLKVIKSK